MALKLSRKNAAMEATLLVGKRDVKRILNGGVLTLQLYDPFHLFNFIIL